MPCGNYPQVILHSIAGHQGMPSAHIKLINTIWTHAHLPGCAIDLVVTREKCQISLLVTTASPVST